MLDLGLTLAALGLRDLICLAEGAPEAALDPARAERLAGAAHGARPAPPARGRRALRGGAPVAEVNVTEDLALEALGYRLAALVGSSA